MTAPCPDAAVRAIAQQFRSDGFTVLRRAIPPGVVSELREMLVSHLPPDQSASQPAQRMLPRLVERDRRFRDVATCPAILQLLTVIFGVGPRLICSYGHDKPAATLAHTSLHSDVAHLPGVPHHQSMLMVKVAVALTAARTGSGATVVYPGSHRERTDRPPTLPAHAVELDPGDVLFFHANIRHTATANTSSQPRLGLWFVYALPWMRAFPGEEPSEALLAEISTTCADRPELTAVFGMDDPYATTHYRAATQARAGELPVPPTR